MGILQDHTYYAGTIEVYRRPIRILLLGIMIGTIPTSSLVFVFDDAAMGFAPVLDHYKDKLNPGDRCEIAIDWYGAVCSVLTKTEAPRVQFKPVIVGGTDYTG